MLSRQNFDKYNIKRRLLRICRLGKFHRRKSAVKECHEDIIQLYAGCSRKKVFVKLLLIGLYNERLEKK